MLFVLGLEDWRAPIHIVSCWTIFELLFQVLAWRCGRVSRLPAVSQGQTILSGPGGLEGAATLSVLLVY